MNRFYGRRRVNVESRHACFARIAWPALAFAHVSGQQLPETSGNFYEAHCCLLVPATRARMFRVQRPLLTAWTLQMADGIDRSHELLHEPSDRERLRMAPQGTPGALHRRARWLIEEARRDFRPPAVLDERRRDDALAIVLGRVVRW